MKISNTLIILSLLGLAITVTSNPIPITDDNANNNLNRRDPGLFNKLKSRRDPGILDKLKKGRRHYDDEYDTEIDDDTEDDISNSESDADDDEILNISRRDPGFIDKLKKGRRHYDDEYDTEIDDDTEDDDSGEDSDSEEDSDDSEIVDIHRREPGFFSKLGSAIKKGSEIVPDFPQM